jgi:hypothetical protein
MLALVADPGSARERVAAARQRVAGTYAPAAAGPRLRREVERLLGVAVPAPPAEGERS